MTLPDGFRVRLDPAATRADGGALLVGGSPLTAMRLTPRAQAMVEEAEITVTDQASSVVADRLIATNLGQPELSRIAPPDPHALTVVIPARDRAQQLDRTLAGLAPMSCIVVDDASREPAAIAAVAVRHGAELLVLQANVGPAAARNAGLARVSTPFVAFVDSDVEVTADALLRLMRHFADPNVALVGPRVVGVSRSDRPRWFERYDAEASSLTLGRRAASVAPGAGVAWLPGACLVGRTSALASGFDDKLRVGEDVDLVWRLTASGHRVRYDPTVEVAHDARATLRTWLGRKAFYGAGGGVLAQRHGDRLAPAVLTPTYALAGAVLLLRRRWSAPVAVAAMAVGTAAVRSKLPAFRGREEVAVRLAARGMGWAVRQESALLLRHWWPVTAVAAIGSRNVRRALVTAVGVDFAVMLHEHRDTEQRPPVAVLFAGRRLDDLAYGAGLWWGSARYRTARPLTPRRPTSRPH